MAVTDPPFQADPDETVLDVTAPPADGALDTVEAALVRLMRDIGGPGLVGYLSDCADVDVERGGFVVMARIEELDGAELGEIAYAAHLEPAVASRHIARLVAHGLVRRRPDPDDRRVMRHELTPEGRRVLVVLRTARRQWLQGLLDAFDPAERQQFAGLFQRFVDALHRSF